MSRLLLPLTVLLLTGCPNAGKDPGARGDPYADDLAEPEPFENWYPESITPPPGTKYPCALDKHPLPLELPGIPNRDRRFVNHVFSQVLEATWAKLKVYKALGGPDQATGLAAYDQATAAALTKIKAEPIPAGLEPFHRDVVKAIELQRAFFQLAGKKMAAFRTSVRADRPATEQEAQRRWKEAWNGVHRIPQGKQASGLLLGTYNMLKRRYGKHWPRAMERSVYHHLCALDLF